METSNKKIQMIPLINTKNANFLNNQTKKDSLTISNTIGNY